MSATLAQDSRTASSGVDRKGRVRRGARSQLITGGEFWLLDPRADEITFAAVCIGGAREPRYGNQTVDRYCVAEHELIVSIYCERIARARGWPEHLVLLVAREGLLHDASEGLGMHDMMRPLKRQPGMETFRAAENALMLEVYKHFGVEPTAETTALMSEVDDRIVVDEVEALMLDPHMYMDARAATRPRDVGLGCEIASLSESHAVVAWTQRFAELFPDYPEENL